MTILKTPIPQSVMDSLNDYIVNKIDIDKFNPSNMATGGTSITLNKNNGILIYTTAIPNAVPKTYTLLNNKIKATSRIFWSIVYSPLGDEAVVPCYYQVQNGIASFIVGIIGGSASDTSIEIDFQILNP